MKGAPELALGPGRRASYAGGSGSNTLVFLARPDAHARADLVFERGAVIASEAAADLLFADTHLPRPTSA